jgi:hypothetical protein
MTPPNVSYLSLRIILLMVLLSATCLAADVSEQEAWYFNGEQTESFLGCSVASAGDVNGDGYDDLIIGAYGFDNTETSAGKVYVFYGSPDGPSTLATWSKEGNYRNHVFGRSAASAGDVNNDGYDDVIVGAWNYDQAFVYYGSSSGLKGNYDWIADLGADPREAFGWSVSTAGDVNGDSYDDIIVGMPNYGNGQSGEGKALVYHGSENGLNASPNWSFEINQQDAHFGYSVSAAGDVNGDGYSDVIVGAYNQGIFDTTGGNQAGEGHAHVFYGSASGLSAAPNWTAESNITGAYFGYSVSDAGDVNADGFGDVIVGANGYNLNGLYNVGRAYIYHGSSTGLSTTPAWSGYGSQQYAYFGSSVSSAGDLNGDGCSEIIIGADGKGFGSFSDNGGEVFVFSGSRSGVSQIASWTSSTGQINDQFGYSVSDAGDVNGDGADDVAVGAPMYDGSVLDAGRAYLYFGLRNDCRKTLPWLPLLLNE